MRDLCVLRWVAAARYDIKLFLFFNVCDNYIMERFYANILKTDTCWLWQGYKRKGYGSIMIDKKRTYAHRISYEIAKGKIPSGLVIDHLCRTPACVNPDHLEAVTSAENIARGVHHRSKRTLKTHCVHGHKYTKANTVEFPERHFRYCRTCHNSNARKYYNSNRLSMS